MNLLWVNQLLEILIGLKYIGYMGLFIATTSNAISRLGTTTTRAITIGSSCVQHSTSRSVNRIRGRVARTHTIANATKLVFSASTTAGTTPNVSNVNRGSE